MLESSITLSEQYELLKKEQKEAKLAEEKTKQQLQRKKEEVVRSNKVRLTRSASILDLPVSFTSCLFETLLKVKLHFFSESVRKTGVCSSKTAAEQLQTRQEEVPGQKPRVDGREEPSGGGEEQVLVPSEVLAFTIRTFFSFYNRSLTFHHQVGQRAGGEREEAEGSHRGAKRGAVQVAGGAGGVTAGDAAREEEGGGGRARSVAERESRSGKAAGRRHDPHRGLVQRGTEITERTEGCDWMFGVLNINLNMKQHGCWVV